ncbi:MAG TPA: M56 family metallopeptidase [Verrucomicrobiae bacterium]|nr:M56 family metallopeptidase [Verrucomicrobiae bacterium]
MNSFIETLNHWGDNFLDFAGTMLWQSSLFIVILFALDFLLRRKIRASIRYTLWLVLLLKLILPPTLALPTSPVWWLYKTPAAIQSKPQFQNFTITYDSQSLPAIPENLPTFTPPKPKLNISAWLLLISLFVSAALLLWLLARWWQVARQARRAEISEHLTILAKEVRQFAGIKLNPAVKLAANTMSPAVCGLFRPVILIPQSLAENFSDEQLRAVLLHELIHLRRRDVWVNFLQSLLQIVYWWQPLVWLANARIRRVREEAVDDAVMRALDADADIYAPTLLEVAKFAFRRPLASLGLVGILESRSALRQRIERLVNFRTPKKAGLTLVSLLGILAFTAVAVPMGEAPDSSSNRFSGGATLPEETLTLKVDPAVFIRNVKAQANWRMDSPTDDWTKILLDILRSETVDCPHGIKFNHQTGEITMRNTPEQLEIFRQVIGQLNRADGKYELSKFFTIHRKNVLVDARFFWMSSDDREKLVADLQSERGKNERAPHWIISPEQFDEINQRIASLNLHPFQRPRIQTAHGVMGELYVRDKTNGVEFDCEPFVADAEHSGLGRDGIALAFKTEIVGDPTGPEQKLVGTNHYQTSGEIGVEDGGGFVVSAKNPDGSPTNLVIVVNAEVVTNTTQRLATVIQRTANTNEISTNLFTRHFRVDTNIFVSNVRQTTKLPANTPFLDVFTNYLAFVGVDLQPPKSIFYNDRLSELYVRGTMGDLDKVENVLMKLTTAAPQIHIKARFVEAPKGTLNGLKKIATVPNQTNESAGFVGILSGKNFKTTWQNLQTQAGVEELAEPEVTTTSGRQTEMRATKTITILTGFEVTNSETMDTNTIAITPQTNILETGPIFDVVPYVLSDNNTIFLTAIPSLTKFGGYAGVPTNAVLQTATNSAGGVVTLPAVWPVLERSQESASVNLYDGQTLVLAGFQPKQVRFGAPDAQREKAVADHIRDDKRKNYADEKELIIFVTVVLVDAAGNRIHSDDKQNGIPPATTQIYDPEKNMTVIHNVENGGFTWYVSGNLNDLMSSQKLSK